MAIANNQINPRRGNGRASLKGKQMTKKQNIEFIAEYFGYEDNDLDEWKKDAELLTNEQIAGICNLVKRHKGKRD